MDDLLTTAEAAKFLGVTTKTIKRWRNSGKLVPYQTGENGYSLYSAEQLGTFKAKLGTTGETGESQTRETGETGESQTRETGETGESQTRETGETGDIKFESEYLRLIESDIAESKKHLEELGSVKQIV